MAVYEITIEVTDPDVSAKTLRWLLSEAGEVLELKQWTTGDVDKEKAKGE
jgi:hypothetical protein